MTLVYLSLAWLAGIALADRLPDAAGLFWLAPAGLAGIGWLVGRERRSTRVFFGCGVLLALGAARYALGVPRLDQDALATFNDQGVVAIEGVVVDAPDVRDTHVNLRVRAERVTIDGQPHDVEGLALVQAPRYGEYRYGDGVRVRGELGTPPEFEDFSYRNYLARQGIYSLVRFAEVETVGERRGSPLRRVLLDFRASAREIIVRLLPDPQASLLSGILLGVESGIAPSVRDDFNATGATHVIAISGANLAILAGVLKGVSRRWLNPNWSALVTVAGILVYALFVGGDPAVIRAFVMATVGIAGAEWGRRTFAPATLSFAALLMTAVNPLLLWDVGFLLSLLSTWGIVLYAEPLSGWFERLLSAFVSGETAARLVAASAESIVVTIAAQITTTPLIALFFGRLSLVSLPVNLLIVPAQGPLMVLGGVSVLVAFVVWPLGQLLAWAGWLFLTYTLAVVRAFADLSFASLAVSVAPGAVWSFYLLLFGGTFVAAQPPDRRARWREALGRGLGVKALATAGLVLALMLGIVAWSLPDGRLHIYFLDVPGSATLIQTPTGRRILVDAGGSGRALSTELGSALPFWVRTLDLVILTQPVKDHIGGLPPVMGRYRVDALLANGQRGEGEVAEALWATLEEEGVPVQVAQAGMQVRTGDSVTLTVLHTQAAGDSLDEGDPGQPVVLMLEYGEARVLLTGDLPPEGEGALLGGGANLSASVLQVPWHGNQAVSSQAFLDAVSPQLAIVPVEAGSRYTFPHQAVLDRLETTGAVIYRTGQEGTVHVATDGAKLWVWPRSGGS